MQMNEIRKGGDALALSTDIHVITAEINAYQRVAGEAIFEIGRRLKHVKENDLAHGEWLPWLKSVSLTQQHANRFMRVYDRFANNSPGSDIPSNVTVLELLIPYSDEELDKQRDMPDGSRKKLTEMTRREIEAFKKREKELVAEKERAVTAAIVADRRAQQAEQNYEGIRQAFESLEEQEPEVHYVEVERDNPELEQRLKMYEEKFGDIRNYTDRHTATNTQEVTTSVLSFAKAVRDLAKRHAYLLQYQHVIPLLDHLSRDEYNEAVKALSELSKDFKTADTGTSVIDAEYEEVTFE